MKRLFRVFLSLTYRPLLVRWLSRERVYRYRGIHVIVPPGVFHPGLFFSTRLLLRHLHELNLPGCSLLELGAGSGLISLVAAAAGAEVTASDINPAAVRGIRRSAAINGAAITTVVSDLFDDMPPGPFDVIVINPPYYFKEVMDERQYAWHCGTNGEYFHRLFASAGNFTHCETVMLMVLCEGCDRGRIETIAERYGYRLSCIRVHTNMVEKNFIYRIYPPVQFALSAHEKDIAIQSQEQ